MPHKGMHCHYLFRFLAMDPIMPLPFGISNANETPLHVLDEIPHSQPVFRLLLLGLIESELYRNAIDCRRRDCQIVIVV